MKIFVKSTRIMTRKEKIQQKAREEAWYIADTSQTKEEAAIRGYCLGVAYADKTMLDCACGWLKSRLNYVEDYIGDLKVCSFDYETVEEFITAFRQAMEGGAE